MARRAQTRFVHRAQIVALIALGASACTRPEARSAVNVELDPCSARGLPKLPATPLLERAAPVHTRIARVQVRGTQRIPQSIVRAAISVRAGQRFDPERVRADLERIWQLEVFEDVSVEYAESRAGLILSYRVREQPVVAEVVLRGDRVRGRELGLLPGSPYEPARSFERARDLQQSLINDGHRRARVELKGVRRGERVWLCVAVEPGPRLTIERFEFVGNHRIGADELYAAMHTDDRRINAAGGVYRPEALEGDLLYLSALYYDRGLLSVKITPRVRELGSKIRIALEIEEGPEYRIGKLDVSGELVASKARYLELLGSKPGQIFSRQSIQAGLEKLRALHREHGRAELDVYPRTELHPERGIIDVELRAERR